MACPDENSLVAFASGTLDPATHAEVARHVDTCDECAAMVQDAAEAVDEVEGSPGFASQPTAPTPPLAADVPLARGTAVGRYVVLDLLGAGGIGRVYTAYDPELDRRVAIKLLKHAAPVADAEIERWLLREAQAMAQLSHAHVVPVYDVGTHAGQVFVAMKLVRGGTLRAWLRAADRPWHQVRDVVVMAGEGLACAHAAGLVHRDFKPANVLVDEAEVAYVVDFGLARAVAGPPATDDPDPLTHDGDRLLDADLTQTGAIVGTPAYMAPEQLRGEDVDARADQFAFCVTLYEALFAKRPFSGRTLRDLLASIEAGPPRIDDARRAPAWLRAAIERGLSVTPADRFESIPALLHALTADRRSRRRQWLSLGAVAVVSAAAAGVAGFVLRPQLTAAEEGEIESIVDEARAAAARAYYVYPPAEDPSQATAYVYVRRLEAIEGPGRELARERAGALREEFAGTLRRLGDAFAEREGGAAFAADYYMAAAVFDPDDAHATERMRITPGQLADLSARAESLDFSEDELSAAGVLQILAREDDDEDARREAITRWLADTDVPQPVRTQLQRLYPQAAPSPTATKVAVAPEATDEDDDGSDEPEIPDAGPSRGGTPRSPRPTHPSPSPSPSPAPTSAESTTARDPEKAKAEADLGRQAWREGRTTQASAHFHKALELDSKCAAAASGLSELHFDQGEYRKAVQFGERAIRLAPGHAAYRVVLGDAYLNVLRYADARKQYEKAAALGDGRAAGRLQKLDAKTGG